MNNIYQKSPFKYQTCVLIAIYTLIPLILMGFYKNGIMLYFKDLVKLVYIIKPLLFVLIGFTLGMFLPLIFRQKDNLKPLIYYNLLISLCLSINTNLYLYAGMILALDIMYLLFLKKVKINFVALSVLIIGLTSYFVFNTSFLNHYEAINNHSYGIIDFLLGFSVGGIGTTNIMLILIALVVLAFIPYYKKDISIMGVALYAICCLWGLVAGYTFTEIVELVCSYSVIFALVYIVPINQYSPKKENRRYIYTAFICFVTFILVFFFKCQFGVYIAIIGVNILSFFEKLLLKKRK